jgi:hypothetical protein
VAIFEKRQIQKTHKGINSVCTNSLHVEITFFLCNSIKKVTIEVNITSLEMGKKVISFQHVKGDEAAHQNRAFYSRSK